MVWIIGPAKAEEERVKMLQPMHRDGWKAGKIIHPIWGCGEDVLLSLPALLITDYKDALGSNSSTWWLTAPCSWKYAFLLFLPLLPLVTVHHFSFSNVSALN